MFLNKTLTLLLPVFEQKRSRDNGKSVVSPYDNEQAEENNIKRKQRKHISNSKTDFGYFN